MPQWKGIVGKGFAPDDFAGYVASLTFGAWRPQFVVLHNTASPTLAQWHSVPGAQRIQNLENFYKNVQQWSAGPHLFVADDLIWVFTPLTVPGVHSPSWNSISWGVEMVGDYESEPFGDAVRNNAIQALSVLHATVGLDPTNLKLHKEDPRTTHICPGRNVLKAEMIQAIHDLLAAGEPGEHVPGGVVT
ncbi:MAG: peptidoglycan recognition family protein [Bryobacteraceae bacterium]